MSISEFSAPELTERSLLGAILLNDRSVYEAQAALKAEEFSVDAHRRIFRAMCEVSSDGKAVEFEPVVQQLEHDGDLKRVGGVAYLADLMANGIVRGNLEPLIVIIREAAKRRSLRATCDAAARSLEDPTDKVDDVIAGLDDAILSLRAGAGCATACSVREIVPTLLDHMIAIRRMPQQAIGLTTGLDSLDRATTGIRDDEYWVVGALPSRGKTALGRQIAVANAKLNVPVLVFSHEMTREQLVRTILPAESGVAASRVRDPRYATEREMSLIQETAAEMAGWPLWVADPDRLTARELVATARLHIRRHGVKLIVVDYLQLVEGEGRELRERVSNASNALRTIPKTEGVPVVALSQLARPRDRNENARPSLLDFKETGAIEAHAHVALLLYRPKNNDGEWTGEDEIIIAKQREGLVGYEPVRLDGNRLIFTERAR